MPLTVTKVWKRMSLDVGSLALASMQVSYRFYGLLCYVSVTCESLVSREFSRIFFQFHFSISISGHFHFTFHSRSRFQGIFISLFTLEMSERKKRFTFHFSERVKAFQILLFFLDKKSEILNAFTLFEN